MATASNVEHIVIVTGSSPLANSAVASIPDEAIIVAVDGGLDHALAAGLHPSGLIGDLDSVGAGALVWAEANATIARHPADKDDTDTELALRFVADMMPTRLTMIGGGDRLDHTFAALGALGLAELTSIPVVDAWWGEQHVDVVVPVDTQREDACLHQRRLLQPFGHRRRFDPAVDHPHRHQPQQTCSGLCYHIFDTITPMRLALVFPGVLHRSQPAWPWAIKS